MSEALLHSEYERTAVRRCASAAGIMALFVVSYLLALGIQQAVTVITAKQLGGYALTIEIGHGPLVYSTEVRTRQLEVHARWWARPEYRWSSGIGPGRALAARLAGLAMNLLLACLGLLDLRHRRSRGLMITVASHFAAALTAVVWGLT